MCQCLHTSPVNPPAPKDLPSTCAPLQAGPVDPLLDPVWGHSKYRCRAGQNHKHSLFVCTPFICTVHRVCTEFVQGDYCTYVGLARTVYIHRIWPHIRWYPCHRSIYTSDTIYGCWPTLYIRTDIYGVRLSHMLLTVWRIRAVAVRCTVRCTVIRYGTVRTFFAVFLKIGTVYTVRYGTVNGTVPSWHCQCKNGLRMASPPQNLPF
jgi:hypothetical protein